VQLPLWLDSLLELVPGSGFRVPSSPNATPELGTRNSELGERELIERLRALGLPPFQEIHTHRNRQVMLSFVPGRQIRLHEGYAAAPDEVLRAIISFVTPGARRVARLQAKRTFLAFPADDHAPSSARPRRPAAVRPGDRHLLGELRTEFDALNQEHFGGLLGPIPILISPRMKTRLGELRMDRKTGQPIQIALSRRHLRRDGWAAARETLLHEMVHQWQAETGRSVDHGPEFRQKARDVGITPRAVRRATDEVPPRGTPSGPGAPTRIIRVD
jgi:hypothetical protein